MRIRYQVVVFGTAELDADPPAGHPSCPAWIEHQ